jgi:hypothetical protein
VPAVDPRQNRRRSHAPRSCDLAADADDPYTTPGSPHDERSQRNWIPGAPPWARPKSRPGMAGHPNDRDTRPASPRYRVRTLALAEHLRRRRSARSWARPDRSKACYSVVWRPGLAVRLLTVRSALRRAWRGVFVRSRATKVRPTSTRLQHVQPGCRAPRHRRQLVRWPWSSTRHLNFISC